MGKIVEILEAERKRGVLSHSASYNIRHHLFEEIDGDIIQAA